MRGPFAVLDCPFGFTWNAEWPYGGENDLLVDLLGLSDYVDWRLSPATLVAGQLSLLHSESGCRLRLR